MIFIWIIGLIGFCLGAYLLARATRIGGTRVLAMAMLLPPLMWWFTSALDPAERAISAAFSPILAPITLLQHGSSSFWPALLTASLIFAIAIVTFPKTTTGQIVSYLITLCLLAELPFWVQDQWSRPRALAQADARGLTLVEMPIFRQAVRQRLGSESRHLQNSNGRALKDDTLYLWSYGEMTWYPYDPDWWK